MRTYLSTLTLIIAAMWSLDARSYFNSCLTDLDSQQTLSEQIERDLVKGDWTAEMPSAEGNKARVILHFQPDGRAEMLEWQAFSRYQCREFQWAVGVREDDPYLEFYDLARGEHRIYELVCTYHRLELTETRTGDRLALRFNAPANTGELDRLRNGLVGEWANSLYPFEVAGADRAQMAGAFFYYQFNADGSYRKSLGDSESQIDETGRWEISADGQYLLLHTEEYEGWRKVRKTTVAQIKLVMWDEMVLALALRINDQRFCTDIKDFYFSKV